MMSSDLKKANAIIETVNRIIQDAEFVLNDNAKRILKNLRSTAHAGFDLGSGALPNVKIAIGKLCRELRAKTKSQTAAKNELKDLILK